MSSSILSQRDKDLVRNYLIGGAAAGGGVALATALVNYLRHLKDDADESDDDDDTIKIYKQAPQEKVAMTLGGPLALTGGIVSAAGTYALVNKLYEALRKKQAQDKLDEAQNIFLETQGYKKLDKKKKPSKEEEESEKSASAGKGMSASELGISIPLALPILMALGSGVVAHKLLNKSFPIKKKDVQSPKRIEIVDAPVEEEEELDKSAGITDTDGFEFLLRTINMTKAASSDVSNLIATAADGRLKDFRNTAGMIGFADALDTVKGASSSLDVDPLTEQIAISCIAKSAAVGAQTELLAASEFAELYPAFFKAASNLSEKKKNALYKIACIFGHAIRSEIAENSGITSGSLTKKADVSGAIFESLLDVPEEYNSHESNDSTDTSREEANINKKKKSKFVYSSKRGFRLAKKLQDDDVIDKILSPGN